jgi:hypothetical protein
LEVSRHFVSSKVVEVIMATQPLDNAALELAGLLNYATVIDMAGAVVQRGLCSSTK